MGRLPFACATFAFFFVLAVIAILIVVHFAFGNVDVVRSQLLVSMASHNSCVSEMTSLEAESEMLKRQKAAVQDSNARLKNEIKNLQSQLKVKEDSFDYVKRELKSASQGLAICTKQLDKINGMNEIFVKRLKFLERERIDYKSEIDQRRKDVEGLLWEISQMHFKFSNTTDNDIPFMDGGLLTFLPDEERRKKTDEETPSKDYPEMAFPTTSETATTESDPQLK